MNDDIPPYSSPFYVPPIRPNVAEDGHEIHSFGGSDKGQNKKGETYSYIKSENIWKKGVIWDVKPEVWHSNVKVEAPKSQYPPFEVRYFSNEQWQAIIGLFLIGLVLHFISVYIFWFSVISITSLVGYLLFRNWEKIVNTHVITNCFKCRQPLRFFVKRWSLYSKVKFLKFSCPQCGHRQEESMGHIFRKNKRRISFWAWVKKVIGHLFRSFRKK